MPKTTSCVTAPFDKRTRELNAEARTKAVRAALGDPPIKLAEHSLNITHLSLEDRAHLLLGPKISVVADNNVPIRKGVPLRALAASSTKVNDLLHINPKLPKFYVHGNVNKECIERLLDIFTSKQGIEAENIELESTSFSNNVLMYQACSALRIHYSHTKPLLHALCEDISSRRLEFETSDENADHLVKVAKSGENFVSLLSKEKIDIIVNNVPPRDPLFKHLATHIRRCRDNKDIGDIKAFEEWLNNKKTLQRSMVGINQGHKRIRKENKEQKTRVVNMEWRKKEHENEGVLRDSLNKYSVHGLCGADDSCV
jgi:hypothetical protein